MGHMFLEGNSIRRRFFDRLVYSFDAEHSSHIYSYEHHMRERNKLLSEHNPDAAWLKIIEDKMASYSVAIAASRLSVLEHLSNAMASCSSVFPRADVALLGDVENMLNAGDLAIDVEHKVADILQQSRADDAKRGRAGYGVHKTEMKVLYVDKGLEAEHCSTGEQKSLLISILLAHARAKSNWHGVAPALLLDEVVAHLDINRRKELFSKIEATASQIWMTGTDAADFSALEGDVQFIRL